MSTESVIDILLKIVPIIIAGVSLIYVIIQRRIVKRELMKKKYLENALTNLNEGLTLLNKIFITPNVDHAELVDTYNDAEMVVWDIIRIHYDFKVKEFVLDISYRLRYYEGEKISSETRVEVYNFADYKVKWFIDLINSGKLLFIQSDIRIRKYQRHVGNEITFHDFIWALQCLNNVKVELAKFEEVYDSISPNCVKKVNNLFEELAKAVFDVFSQPNEMEIDLDRFSNTDEICRFLIEETLNFSEIAKKFSKVSEIISELSETRKQLFLKIS